MSIYLFLFGKYLPYTICLPFYLPYTTIFPPYTICLVRSSIASLYPASLPAPSYDSKSICLSGFVAVYLVIFFAGRRPAMLKSLI